MSAIKFQNKSICFTDDGKGKPIVLLHGFTESSRMWKNLAVSLSKKYRVVCIDLPGHGKSECINGVHTMDLMAEVVFMVLKKLRIGKCLMAGHSMGGYVTLAFAVKHPQMLKGFTLFHSHCFSDTPGEQENRKRTIELVKQDKFGFLAQFIPELFPVEVHKKFAKPIEKLIRQSARMSKEGITAALEGMKVRQDQSELLKTTKVPVLFIIGLKDPKAPMERLWEMITLPARSEVLILRQCGHMGYIEAPEETLAGLAGFAGKYA
ncbi:MAG: alpha/beta hydrolase [Bacteroidota bacterium]